MTNLVDTTPTDILKKHFGYDSFRHQQKEIIHHILEGRDALVLMPTGGGKSLCYQVPALIFEGVTIVISPLIALMKDQVDALRLNGISAAYLNSSLSQQEQAEVMRLLRDNRLKLLYLAPERLVSGDKGFINFLKDQAKLSMIAIDEAHCISQWGHDFRPEYTQLATLKSVFPEVPVVALTATADKLTQDDILQQLKLHNPKKFVSSFNRENIYYFVSPKRRSYDQLLQFLNKHKDDTGIIYTLSRASAESLAEQLIADGYDARPYHAGLDRDVRDKHQDLFIKDQIKIITATIAFGMGIDKSNVRFVVHMDLPKNIEGYYQETGRAGRDGLKSEALLFYSYADVKKLKSFVEVEGNTQQSEIMLKKLNEMAEYGELRTCRRKYLLNYFDEEAADECGSCDVCLSEEEKFDGTVIAQKVLSAVTRLEERFGTGYVIDFLRGSKSAKIWDKHKSLKTYGVGADIGKEEWNHYIKDLIHLNYLAKDDGKYPVLKLTHKSKNVLQGKEQVQLFMIKQIEEPVISVQTIPVNQELFTTLKALRMEIAQRENVPPYIVFSDATLQELATYKPLSREDLAEISGFGAVKMDKYGAVFLKAVVDFCQGNSIHSQMHQKPKKRKKKPSNTKAPTKKETLKMFREGKTIEEIADLRDLKFSTVENHLNEFVQTGELNVLDLISKEVFDEILPVVQANDGLALKPVKEKLRDEITYGQIRTVVNHLRYEEKQRK
ncbi:ATP-dependent DNA helicase RecQ [Fulvivirga imtechensis AK7]|uniref:DNA helicase RecQ n=1 Tax=Fulvivirga imtechensis AK7 TaxID=1237149 RepID=L8JKB9_9BACT|nr:DNA helicase RecQ [Fulvivirga imtechensis]ELR69351.1 ATP-dependent DNA helicase RecQ [Fulvivirga imtechensis AK7]